MVDAEHAICRQINPLYMTDALRYASLLQRQGWREVEGHGQAAAMEGVEDLPLWFERPIDGNCSNLITLHLVPPPPESYQGPAILIHAGYEPVCGAERQAP